MTGHCEDTGFDKRLLTARALQRVDAFHGDLVQQWLLAEQDGDAALAAKVRAAGALYRCRDGSAAVTDDRLAGDVLRDPRFTNVPTSPDISSYTLACVDEVIRAEATVAAPSLPVTQHDVDAAVDRAVRARGAPVELDLVTEVIWPTVADLLRVALDIEVGRRDNFRRLAEQAAISLDAAVCPPRLPDAYSLEASLRELRNLCGVEGLALAVVGGELAVNLATNSILRLFEEPPSASAAGAWRDDAAARVEHVLLRDSPLRLHRMFTDDDVELAGHRIDANSRILVLGTGTGRELGNGDATALAVAAHPQLASLVIAIAVAVSTALCGQLPRLRPAGPLVRRLRAPVTRAVVRFPVTVTDFEVQ